MKDVFFTKIKSVYAKLPLKVWILGGALLIALIGYSVTFFIPKSVQFSYAQQTCVGQLVLFPDIQKTTSDDFTIQFSDELRIGNVSIAAMKLCLEPERTPSEGSHMVTVAPFGGVFARLHLSVTTPEAPTARASDIVGKTISTAQPLTVKLTSPDIVHEYNLKIADKATSCRQADGTLSCDIAKLNLAQGISYAASLHQEYKDETRQLVKGTIETLQPLVLEHTSITKEQVVYDAPTSVVLTFDQPVESAQVKLVKYDGDTIISSQTLKTTQAGKELTAAFDGALDRESQYRLELAQAIGENGSSLVEPVTIPFKTSGGPKVTNVSIGTASVARSAAITVTFDQAIDKEADIAKLARVEGVSGTVRHTSDTQLTFTIQGGDCTAFSLVVDKGLKSGSNGEVSKEAWRHASRTICGTSWVIGYSVQGRAIVAYSFGSGARTILFTGGMHGSERSGQQTMQAWAEYLQAYGAPVGTRVVVVPNTNPDGIAAGSRNNSRNVNIDRNFPTANWQASIETASGTLPTGGGTSAGSEPETAALMALTRQLRPRLEVSFHAQGRLVGANKFGDSVAIGSIYANMVGYQTMFTNPEEVMGYAMTGEYEDWMGEEMGIPAILIELPTPSGNYLQSQLAALKRMLNV